MPVYGEDLTYIHDQGHGDLARAAARALVELLGRSRRSGGRVVDLGCGSGILARAMLDAGYDVTGCDLSVAMIETARRRAPEADLRVGSFLDAAIPPCVAVVAIGECFSYQFDEEVDGPGLDRLFERIHAALEPRGLLVFDVAAPGRLRGKSPQRGFVEGPDWAVLVEADEEVPARRLTRSITTFRRVPPAEVSPSSRGGGAPAGPHAGVWRRDHEVHVQRLYQRRELDERLRAAGFRVRALACYGELRLGPGHLAFCARKPR